MVDLIIKAKHFKKTDFSDNCNCAIAKAAKDQFKSNNVFESAVDIEIDGSIYKHEFYSCCRFDQDMVVAKGKKFSDEVIRTIQLTPIN